jgi:hypothetical protein
MGKINVVFEGNGTVRIKLKKKDAISPTIAGTRRFSTPSRGVEGILLSSSFINQMEIRVESVFRPKEHDVEVVYALSGQDEKIDMLHNMSSNEVVAHASPEMISYYAEKMIEYIREERTEDPGLIIHVHSHPSGLPIPSDVDRKSMIEVAREMKEIIPNSTILFGIHAIGNENRHPRTLPVRIAENRIRWTSITRIHEVAFFDEKSNPVDVRIG